MPDYQLYINGEFVDAEGGATFESINPHDGSVFATCARAGAADAKKALQAARDAFPAWSQSKPSDRAKALKAIAGLIQQNMTNWVGIEAQDSGSVLRKGMADMAGAISCFRHYADAATSFVYERPADLIERPGLAQLYVLKEPVGVCSQIIPWNFPLVMLAWKVAPALAMGNTVAIKPAEETPATAMELARAIHEAGILPPGVLNILPGGAEAGRELAINPIADKVSFTGSTVIGKEVMRNAADTLKRVTLELGGKSANIVCEDADLTSAIDAALYATFFHGGQACESGTRLFLPESLHDDVLSKIVEKTNKIRVGNPMEMKSDVGPVVSKKQFDRVMGYIEKGKAEGARVVAGGERVKGDGLEKGYYIRPTIFADVKNDMTVAREEIFGPVLCVLKYRDLDEAIALANESSYGLGGGVWTKDLKKGFDVAKRIRTGTVWINEYHMINHKAPFGGYKESGIGREHGIEGLEAYTETKTVYMDLLGDRNKKAWYDIIAPRDR